MTRQERVNELKNLIGAEDTKIKNQILAILQPHINMPIGIRMNRSGYNKELFYELTILNQQGESVFATGVNVNFDERYSWKNNVKVEDPDSYKMAVNYGSCGYHTAYDDKGAIKQSDIMIGKVWEYEDELTQIYDEIDWTNLKELEELLNEIHEEESAKRRAEAEEKRRQEVLQLEIILDHLCPGRKITDPTNEWNEFIIDKVGRKNITLDRKLWINRKWTYYIEKYQLARYIKENNLVYTEGL